MYYQNQEADMSAIFFWWGAIFFFSLLAILYAMWDLSSLIHNPLTHLPLHPPQIPPDPYLPTPPPPCIKLFHKVLMQLLHTHLNQSSYGGRDRKG